MQKVVPANRAHGQSIGTVLCITNWWCPLTVPTKFASALYRKYHEILWLQGRSRLVGTTVSRFGHASNLFVSGHHVFFVSGHHRFFVSGHHFPISGHHFLDESDRGRCCGIRPLGCERTCLQLFPEFSTRFVSPPEGLQVCETKKRSTRSENTKAVPIPSDTFRIHCVTDASSSLGNLCIPQPAASLASRHLLQLNQ